MVEQALHKLRGVIEILEDQLFLKGQMGRGSSQKWLLKLNSMSDYADFEQIYQELNNKNRRDIQRQTTYNDINSMIIKENTHTIKNFCKHASQNKTLDTAEATTLLEDLIRFYLDLKKPYIEWFT